MIQEYLILSTRELKNIRLGEKLQPLESLKEHDTPHAEALINDLGGEFTSSRDYKPQEYPAYLAFEYYCNVLMRPAQVEKLESFLKGEDENLVMEMIMGSGKSKVPLPLLGLLRANGDNISMMIVPQALFESISQDTQNILHSFGQGLYALHFDRDTKFTRASLQGILDSLEHIKENRECLVMTSKSVLSLVLKYIEKSTEHMNSTKQAKGILTIWIQKFKISLLYQEKKSPICYPLHYAKFAMKKLLIFSYLARTPNRSTTFTSRMELLQ